MTRGRGLLLVTLLILGGARHAQAQGFFDSRDIMGGGPNFFGGGASPIPRTTVMYPTNYSPGTIVISTAERRLYLVLGNGRALRYGIGVGRDGFRWGGTHRITAKKEWPSWTPPSQMLRRRPDCRATWPAVSTIRSARARCISAARSIGSTVPTIRNDRSGGIVGLLPHDQ